MKLLMLLIILGILVFGRSSAQADEQRDTFIIGTTFSVPIIYCGEKQFFRQCFSVTQEECQEFAAASARACFEQIRQQIPLNLDSKSKVQWGKEVGACVRSTYESVLVDSKRKINSEICNKFFYYIEDGSQPYAGWARDTWINQLTTSLPAAMCKKNQVFRRCFRISPAECEETAASAARICLNQYREQIPSMLDSKSGSQWGSIVGGCAGKNFSFVMNEKFVNNRHCKYSNFCIELRKAAENIMAQRYKGQSAATMKSGTDDNIMHKIINGAFERPYITPSYADQQKEITEFGNRMFDICVDPEQFISSYADQQNANN